MDGVSGRADKNRSLTRVLTGNNPHPSHNRKGMPSSPTL